MITVNDKLFFTLFCCGENISTQRLTYFAYMFQMAGFNLDFRYSLSSDKLRSHGVLNTVDELTSMGYIEMQSKGHMCITDIGNEALCSFVMSYDEIEFATNLLETLKEMTTDELHFVVVTDIVVEEVKNSRGLKGLIEERDRIENTISGLTSEYSKENFDNAMSILNWIRRWRQ